LTVTEEQHVTVEVAHRYEHAAGSGGHLLDGLTRSLAGFDPVPPDAPRRAGLLPYLGGADALVTAVVPLDQVGVDDVDGDTGELGRAACPLQRGGSHLREVKALEQTAAARGHPPRRCPEAAGP